MIKGYEKLRIPDENKMNEIIVEVNWNPFDPQTKNCKYIRITMGGKTAVMKKEHLMGVLFAIGNEEEQRKMAQQMKQDNIDREVIKKYTGLSDEEIDE